MSFLSMSFSSDCPTYGHGSG